MNNKGELHVLVISDPSVLGGETTTKKALELGSMIGELSLHVSRVIPHVIYLTTKEEVLTKIIHIFDLIVRKKKPCFLMIYLNGHSRLWKGNEAFQIAQSTGQSNLLAQEDETLRFSSVMHDGKIILSPNDMMKILSGIPLVVSRTILFLDTCHSMSLVSVLLCPARDIRIIHSTGESERTWQTIAGSVMAISWTKVCSQLVQEKKKKKRVNLDSVFWTATKLVAIEIQSQVLTTGPGSSYWFF